MSPYDAWITEWPSSVCKVLNPYNPIESIENFIEFDQVQPLIKIKIQYLKTLEPLKIEYEIREK